jgi:hypothetical protein
MASVGSGWRHEVRNDKKKKKTVKNAGDGRTETFFFPVFLTG